MLDKLMQGFVMFARRDNDWTINVNGLQEKSRRNSTYPRYARECVEGLSCSFASVLV